MLKGALGPLFFGVTLTFIFRIRCVSLPHLRPTDDQPVLLVSNAWSLKKPGLCSKVEH
jgi:hypothetical protein